MQAFSFTVHTSYDANSDYALGDIVPSSDVGTYFYQANSALIGGSHSLSNSIQWTAVSSDSIPSSGSNESNFSGITVLKNTEETASVEVESNDDVKSANSIYSDLKVLGNISETDVDYFTFSLSQPSLMTLSSTRMQATIQIFSPDGTELYYLDYSFRGFSTNLSGVSSGNYIVKISSNGFLDYDYDFTIGFAQNISPEQIQSLTNSVNDSKGIGFSVLKDDTNSISVESEPNNLSSKANLIYSDLMVIGNISETDVDYFTFSLTQPSVMTLSTKGMLQAIVQIFGPDGSQLYY